MLKNGSDEAPKGLPSLMDTWKTFGAFYALDLRSCKKMLNSCSEVLYKLLNSC